MRKPSLRFSPSEASFSRPQGLRASSTAPYTFGTRQHSILGRLNGVWFIVTMNAVPQMSKPLPSSLPTAPQQQPATYLQQQPGQLLQRASTSGGLRYPTNKKTIYDRNLNRSRTAELSRASFAYLFGEMVTYAQRRVTGIQDLEKRYACQSVVRVSPTEGADRGGLGSTSKATL